MNQKLLGVSLAASMVLIGASATVMAAEKDPEDVAPAPVTEDMSDSEAAAQVSENPVQEEPTAQTDAVQDDETQTEPAAEEQPAEDTTSDPVEGTEPAAEQGEAAAQADEADNPATTDPEQPASETADPADTTDTDEDSVDPQREGTFIPVNLTLDTKVDGVNSTVVDFDQNKDVYNVQVGGSLDMKGVWEKYGEFKFLYTLKNGETAFRSKNLKGNYTYTFQINPEVVSVNESILCDPAAWQKAFEEGSTDAETFFSYMKCTSASYDPATGTVTVGFTIDENGTKMVSVATIEDGVKSGSKPASIDAYSPEGALFITPENFKKGANAVPGVASFKGEIDMSPWMALIFPITFEGNFDSKGLNLDVPDGKVEFSIENGTWADGSTDPITVSVPMDVANIDGKYVAAGTFTEEMIPKGMKAAEGFDQITGHWDPALVLSENGVIGAENTYVFSFDKLKEPVTPETPEKPAPEQTGTPAETVKPTQTVAQTQKPNRTDSVHTDVFTGTAALLGLQGISAAVLGLLKKKRK